MTLTQVRGYCALCVARCGAVATVEDGRLVKVDPDREHPTGQALCAKGRAAPEMQADPRRLTQPLIRTGRRHDPDPAWRTATWDEALGMAGERMRAAIEATGPESIALATTSPSGTAISDAFPYITRLAYAIGTPNIITSTEICQWHRDNAAALTFGYGQPAPDLDHAGCILLWGHNPKAAWLTRMTKIVAAQKRGAKIVVVDPRRDGMATRADVWLAVRPGADAALALGIAAEILRSGLHDEAFVRSWTSAPALVRDDDGRLLDSTDLGSDGGPVGWSAADRPRPLTPGAGDGWALHGMQRVETVDGAVSCRPVWQHLTDVLEEWPLDRVEAETWVPADEIRRAAELLTSSRPTCYATWSGVGQASNATQTDRAISILYALIGDLQVPGGNVTFTPFPRASVYGDEMLSQTQAAKAIGLAERPLGPPSQGLTITDAAFRAMLEGEPYRLSVLLAFGTNLVLSQADSRRTAEALRALDLHIQVEHTMTPTALLADIVLPANMAWEREALWTNFGVDQRAAATAQLRPKAAMPPGEARSDLEIIFGLASHLGLGGAFWGGSIERAWDAELAPAGLTADDLRRAVGHRVELDLDTRHRAYEQDGFPTRTGRVELYSEALHEHGQQAVPNAEPQPAIDVALPLLLTSAKVGQYLHSQNRGVETLRAKKRLPELALHPDAAARRHVEPGDWVRVRTARSSFRAVAVLSDGIDERVVVGQHGWWQDCPPLGEPGYPALDESGANINLATTSDRLDPVSGSVPLRGIPCEISRVKSAAA